MRSGGGKQKGNQFEREICAQLSKWVTNGKKSDCFWRSAMSGGRATLAYRKGQSIRAAGDITSVAPEGHVLTDYYLVECKFYKKLDIASFILDDKGVLSKFWKQAKKQAREHMRMPLLIAKENGRKPIIVSMPRSLTKVCYPEPALTHNPEIRRLSDVLKLKFLGKL
jgi:hypothetical protein